MIVLFIIVSDPNIDILSSFMYLVFDVEKFQMAKMPDDLY